jgi:hypothetical protein
MTKDGRGLGATAHTCNASYLRDKDQEDYGPRPAWAKSQQEPMSTN